MNKTVLSFSAVILAVLFQREARRALLSVFLLSVMTSAVFSDEIVALPENLERAISERTSGVSSEEKEMIAGWPPGKKLAEFFCQESALIELGKSFAGADRVFLSMSDDEPPRLVSQNRIEGKGSVRHDEGWTDITYQCEVDLRTGKPNEFVFSKTP